jgi:uncharacterized membrane protein YeaQ/YmgE (transglycosylase-associated protein family)
MGIIISIIMAIVIGFIGSAITNNHMPGGVIGAMIAGFVGAWIGSLLLGNWGPVIGGFAIIPAIIGAALFILLLALISGGFRRSTV